MGSLGLTPRRARSVNTGGAMSHNTCFLIGTVTGSLYGVIIIRHINRRQRQRIHHTALLVIHIVFQRQTQHVDPPGGGEGAGHNNQMPQP